jgi:hypothetical protein
MHALQPMKYLTQTISWIFMQTYKMVRPGSRIPALTTRILIGTVLGMILCTHLHAAPWVDTGSQQTRHHLQSLVDSGVLHTPVTAWPLMWRHIKHELDHVEPAQLSASQLWSYQYLRHELRKAMRDATFQQTTSLGNSVGAVGDFSSNRREQYESKLNLNLTTQKSAINLRLGYAHEPDDDESLRFDGSYLSRMIGNWALGIGAVDRWWGPGWDSSLILSHEARPAPGLFLQRNSSQAFESPWLSWLGPWQLVTFMSQLESERHIPDARLWGMRLNIRPLKSLELGFSRTAMWGGDGRPGDLDTFLNLLLGKDNRGDAGIEENKSNEPGNQLAGIDWRWGYGYGGITGAFYGQLIGEDEAGGMPSRHIGMTGAEIQTAAWETQLRFSFETLNTTVYFYESDKKASNVAYEHQAIYASGYRYYGRPIGSSTDNDTEAYILRTQIYFRDGDHLNVSLGKFRFNKDGRNAPFPGGSIMGPETDTERFQASYYKPLNNVLMLEAGLFHYTSPIYYAGEKIDSGGHITLHAFW